MQDIHNSGLMTFRQRVNVETTQGCFYVTLTSMQRRETYEQCINSMYPLGNKTF